MKKRNKVLSIIMSILLVAAVFAGCGEAATSSSGSPDASSGGSSGGADADKSFELTIWHVNTDEGQNQLMLNSYKRFNEKYPNIKINNVPVASDAFETKLAPAIGSDNPPDIFITWSGGKLFTYADADKIVDLTPYMDKDGYKDRFLDGALSQATYKDKLWGVPVENTTAGVFFYDKELFKKYNVEVPKTYDELTAACETFKAAGIAPFALGNKFQWPGQQYYMYLALRLGGAEAFTDAAEGKGAFNSEPFVKAYEMLQDMIKKDYFNKGYNTLDTDAGQPKQLLYSGKAAMYLNGTWEVQLIQQENPDFYDRMGVFGFPSIEGGKGNAVDVAGTLGDNFYSISKACAHPDEAFELIQYLIDDTSVQERTDAGKIPPVKGVKISDPIQQEVLDIVNKAEYVQLWYDLYFTAEVANKFLQANQSAYALELTPKQAADVLQKAYEEDQNK